MIPDILIYDSREPVAVAPQGTVDARASCARRVRTPRRAVPAREDSGRSRRRNYHVSSQVTPSSAHSGTAGHRTHSAAEHTTQPRFPVVLPWSPWGRANGALRRAGAQGAAGRVLGSRTPVPRRPCAGHDTQRDPRRSPRWPRCGVPPSPSGSSAVGGCPERPRICHRAQPQCSLQRSLW